MDFEKMLMEAFEKEEPRILDALSKIIEELKTEIKASVLEELRATK